MRAHRAIVGGKVPVDVEAWLFAIVRNRCHDYFRAAKPTAPLPPELPGGAPSAFEVVEQGDGSPARWTPSSLPARSATRWWGASSRAAATRSSRAARRRRSPR